ncbi:MAG: hypothetical protein Q8P12_00295 [bacterium]|nr:hypothetical protein [bacterium]
MRVKDTLIRDCTVHVSLARAIVENNFKWEAAIIHKVMALHSVKHRSFVQHAASKVREWLGLSKYVMPNKTRKAMDTAKQEGDCAVPVVKIDRQEVKTLSQMHQAISGLYTENTQLEEANRRLTKENAELREEAEVLRAEVASYRAALGGVDDNLKIAIRRGLKNYAS